jgi:hypothetical protein
LNGNQVFDFTYAFLVQKLGAGLSREVRPTPERGCSDGPLLRLQDAPAEAAFFPLATLRLSLGFRSIIVNKRSLKRIPQGCPSHDCLHIFEKILVALPVCDGVQINFEGAALWRIIRIANPQ